jgi:hypothetical protein
VVEDNKIKIKNANKNANAANAAEGVQVEPNAAEGMLEEHNDPANMNDPAAMVSDDKSNDESNNESNEESNGDTNTVGNEDDDVKTTGVETANVEGAMNNQYGERTHEHKLCPRRPRYYGHIHTQLKNVMMTQFSIKKGLKVFGKAGAKANISKMKQLHDRKVIEPKPANMLTREENGKALHYLMFLKKKQCGRIKACGCLDGRK